MPGPAWRGRASTPTALPTIPSYTTIGINAGPLYAALGICAAIIRARASGRGCRFEVAQSDAAAAFNWNGIEGNKAYERPEDEVTGNDGDGKGPRRPVGDNSMTESVRYQYYRSRDGIVLFMASEREFWKNFAYGVGRPELYDDNPGAKYADHARGNVALRRELAEIFATRTTAEWVAVRPRGEHADRAGATTPSRSRATRSSRTACRFRPWRAHGTDLMPSPIKLLDEELPVPAKAAVDGRARHRRRAARRARLRRRAHRGAAQRRARWAEACAAEPALTSCLPRWRTCCSCTPQTASGRGAAPCLGQPILVRITGYLGAKRDQPILVTSWKVNRGRDNLRLGTSPSSMC